MRVVEQLDDFYLKKGRVSVFVGVCQSREQLEAYFEKDYERLGVDDIGFEMGIDFGINSYDEDCAVVAFRKSPSRQIPELFQDDAIFDLDELKKAYPHGLDREYNAICELGELDYEGPVREFESEAFGYFKFLGSYPAHY